MICFNLNFVSDEVLEELHQLIRKQIGELREEEMRIISEKINRQGGLNQMTTPTEP
jgi:hypothetical protein